MLLSIAVKNSHPDVDFDCDENGCCLELGLEGKWCLPSPSDQIPAHFADESIDLRFSRNRKLPHPFPHVGFFSTKRKGEAVPSLSPSASLYLRKSDWKWLSKGIDLLNGRPAIFLATCSHEMTTEKDNTNYSEIPEIPYSEILEKQALYLIKEFSLLLDLGS